MRRVEAIALHDSGLPHNVRRSVGLVTGPEPPVGYLGFAGRGNAGDDSILLAHQRSLYGITLALLPLEWDRQALSLLSRVKRRPLHPLTATSAGVHTPLTYAVELGLVGMTLWIMGVLFGVGGALATPGPPDLDAWRAGLLAVATAYLVVLNAVPPTAWPNRSLWLMAGVVYSGRYLARDTSRRLDPAAHPRG